MIKDKLSEIATRYNVTLTYPENTEKIVAEITGFTGKFFELRFQKVEIRMEIEAELEKMGIDYKKRLRKPRILMLGMNQAKITHWKQGSVRPFRS